MYSIRVTLTPPHFSDWATLVTPKCPDTLHAQFSDPGHKLAQLASHHIKPSNSVQNVTQHVPWAHQALMLCAAV